MRERRVWEEGERVDRWGHGVSDRASDALRGPRALERRAGKRAVALGRTGRRGKEGAGWAAGLGSLFLFLSSFLFQTSLKLFEFK